MNAIKIEPAKIKTYVERVETLEKEKQAIGEDVREVYDEAKKEGLNTKALRKIVAKRRAKVPDPQVEAAMHAYELALDQAAAMVSNGETSLREATAQTGFSKSAIQRQVSHRKRDAVSGTPHFPETGEITEPRSPDTRTSDSASDPTEPVVPTGNEGRAGERGLDELSSNAGAAVKMPPKGLSVLERLKFHSFVDQVSGCWLWTASLFARGAAQFHDEGTHTVQGHRAAWSAVHGPIPAGMFVCHKCDVRRCVNPDHLFLGTHQDNMDDMVAKGRQGPRGGIKITPEEAQAILDDPRPNGDIAIAFNISRSTVGDIKRGARWTNLNRNASRDIPAAAAATTEGEDDGPDEASLHGVGGSLHAHRRPDGNLGDGAGPTRLDDRQEERSQGDQEAETQSLGAVAPSAGRVATTDSDDLAIPTFLRRSA